METNPASGTGKDMSLAPDPVGARDRRLRASATAVRDSHRHPRPQAGRAGAAEVRVAGSNSSDFIGMCDMQGIPSYVNDAGMRLVGLDSLEEAVRTPVREYFFPEDQAFITGEFFPSVLADGRGEVEVRFRHFKPGEASWMAYHVFVLQDADARRAGHGEPRHHQSEEGGTALREADRRKDEFLAMLAHELRNPLAPIRNAVHDPARSAATTRDAATGRGTSSSGRSRQLTRLVDDLLDVSRITSGKIRLRQASWSSCRRSSTRAVESAGR